MAGGIHSRILEPSSTQLQSSKQLGSPLSSPLGLTAASEVQRLNEELLSAKTKLASWEDSWAQAKRACDAWRKEAEDSAEKARIAEQEKLQEVLKKDEVIILYY